MIERWTPSGDDHDEILRFYELVRLSHFKMPHAVAGALFTIYVLTHPAGEMDPKRWADEANVVLNDWATHLHLHQYWFTQTPAASEKVQ